MSTKQNANLLHCSMFTLLVGLEKKIGVAATISITVVVAMTAKRTIDFEQKTPRMLRD